MKKFLTMLMVVFAMTTMLATTVFAEGQYLTNGRDGTAITSFDVSDDGLITTYISGYPQLTKTYDKGSKIVGVNCNSRAVWYSYFAPSGVFSPALYGAYEVDETPTKDETLDVTQTPTKDEKLEVNQTPTKEEILEEYERLNIGEYFNEYKQTPVTSGDYYEGSLTDNSLNQALDIVNFIRYMTGLDSVTLNSEYNGLAQKASLVNSVNATLSHYPTQPVGMSEELYGDGYIGAMNSNISSGYGSVASSIINGYMVDSSSSNIVNVGHRRWVLNPSMGSVGFGLVGRYSAMYVFDRSNTNTHTTATIWPTTNMPVEYFNATHPWSISTGITLSSDVTVTLSKVGGETVTFTSEDKDTSSKYFNVSNSSAGQSGCVIFRPVGMTYNIGDVFEVTVKDGNEIIANYDVTFFSLSENDEETVPEVTVPEVETPNLPQTITAIANEARVSYDGNYVNFEAYTIEQNNYFKLRDLAAMAKYGQFNVEWDYEANGIQITTDVPYQSVGGEMSTPTGKSKFATLSNPRLFVNGVEVYATAYNIDNNNFFKIRDIGELLGWDIYWNPENGDITVDTIIKY